MAIYNEVLAARYARMLQKLFSMKGSVPVKQLAGEIATVLPLFNGAENRFLEAWLVYGKSTTAGPTAGQFPFVQLRNPLGSNVVAVLEKIVCSEGAIDSLTLSITNAVQADANVQQVFGIDSRNTGSSVLIFSAGTQVAAPTFGNGILWTVNIPANTPVEYVNDAIQELPILPGLTIRVSGLTVNVGLNVSFKWRERTTEESERTA